MSGIKRKSAPVKDGHVKGNKKAKIDLGLKSSTKSKGKPEPVKVVEEASEPEEISEDDDSEGGAPLHSDLEEEEDESGDGDEEDENGDSEPIPKAEDGLHPDRAKAVVTNSKSVDRHSKPLTNST
jgi:pumilio family protein 6